MEGREVAQQFEGVDVTSLHGCYYFTSDTEWACYMRLADAPDERIDFRAQVVAWVEDEFPVYQVISAERVA